MMSQLLPDGEDRGLPPDTLQPGTVVTIAGTQPGSVLAESHCCKRRVLQILRLFQQSAKRKLGIGNVCLNILLFLRH
jgi:hypothetical protein